MSSKKKAEETTSQQPVNEQTQEQAAPNQPEQEAAKEAPKDDCAAKLNEAARKLAEAESKRDEYLDSLRRSQADFINYKRHNERARSDGYEEGNREAIAAVLPGDRQFGARHRGGGKGAGDRRAGRWRAAMTYKAMMEALSRRGLEEIPAQGVAFDPELHHAVAREEGEGEPGTILEVYQKGYRVKDKIVRYAMVKVLSE